MAQSLPKRYQIVNDPTNIRIFWGLRWLAAAMEHQAKEDTLKWEQEWLQPLPESVEKVDDEPLGYCPTCNSCGDPGCCPPTSCQTVICHYGESNLKDYKQLLREWDILYGHLESLFGKEAVMALMESTEEK